MNRDALRALILDVLEDNSSRCCDDESDREALADALAAALARDEAE